MDYLTLGEVLDIHEVTVEKHGGSADVLDLELIESAVEQARQTWEGEPLYKTVEEVAAAYWHSIACNHGFVDGNKRTAVLAAAYFLHKNGYDLGLGDDEIIETALGVADGSLRRDQLFEIVKRSVRKDPA